MESSQSSLPIRSNSKLLWGTWSPRWRTPKQQGCRSLLPPPYPRSPNHTAPSDAGALSLAGRAEQDSNPQSEDPVIRTGVLHRNRCSSQKNPNVRDAHTNPETCATRTRTPSNRTADERDPITGFAPANSKAARRAAAILHSPSQRFEPSIQWSHDPYRRSSQRNPRRAQRANPQCALGYAIAPCASHVHKQDALSSRGGTVVAIPGWRRTRCIRASGLVPRKRT